MKIVFVSVLLFIQISSLAQTAQPVKIKEFLLDKREPTIGEVFSDISHFRDSLNLSSVILDTNLCLAAQLQANWLAATGLFQHTQTYVVENSIPIVLQNLRDRGKYAGTIVKAENLHRGWKFLPASIIVKSWAISPCHRANMVRNPITNTPLPIGLAIAHYVNNPNEIIVVLTIGNSTE